MTDEKQARAEARRQRLEEQLRENLRRRKEQARARRQPTDAVEPADAPPAKSQD